MARENEAEGPLACLLSRAMCPRTGGDEHAAESELNWLAQAALLSAR
jgi:hypothetical protein